MRKEFFQCRVKDEESEAHWDKKLLKIQSSLVVLLALCVGASLMDSAPLYNLHFKYSVDILWTREQMKEYL